MKRRALAGLALIACSAADRLPVPATGGEQQSAAAPLPPPSSAWLGMLPDGATKRRFVLDCTGCHQFDGRIALSQGRLRTEAEWSAAIERMLGYAGPATPFPVISSAADPGETAAWLARFARAPVDSPTAGSNLAAVVRRPAIIDEFLLPHPDDLPHDLAITADGELIVTGMFSNAMYVMDSAAPRPSSLAAGEGVHPDAPWRTVAIPVPEANPRGVELGRGGDWWVVLGAPNRLARYVDGRWVTFDVGVYAHSVALDSAGGAWVNGHFSRDPSVLVEITAAGERRDHVLPRHPTMAADPGGPIPYELRTGPDGALWMTELQGNRVVRFDPPSGRARAWNLPTPFSGPRRHDVAPDGIVWIPAYAAGMLLRFDPGGEQFEEVALPVKDALPYVVRVDALRDRVWVGTGAADALLAYRPSLRSWEHYPLPSRGALVRHLAIDPASGDVWLAYGESPGKIPARVARVRLVR